MRPVVIYQIVFFLAGIYNIVFAFWLYQSPDTLFGLAGIASPVPAEYIIPLAISIGGFSLLYFLVVFKPEKFANLIVFGMLSKVMPLLTVSALITFYNWSPKVLLLILFNDIIWWLPFIRFLKFRHIIFVNRNSS